MKKASKDGLMIIVGIFTIMSCNSSREEKVVENTVVTKEKSVEQEKSYTDIGFTLAMTTKGILGKNLMGTITKEGTDAALGFCNINADVILDSMSRKLNASIKRVTDKPRNLDNLANEDELKYIAESKLVLANGGELNPLMREAGERMVGYYPITTNVMCMQCHGDPETKIKETTLRKLKTLYPEDLAKGYTENELRGVWVVEMDKK